MNKCVKINRFTENNNRTHISVQLWDGAVGVMTMMTLSDNAYLCDIALCSTACLPVCPCPCHTQSIVNSNEKTAAFNWWFGFGLWLPFSELGTPSESDVFIMVLMCYVNFSVIMFLCFSIFIIILNFYVAL